MILLTNVNHQYIVPLWCIKVCDKLAANKELSSELQRYTYK